MVIADPVRIPWRPINFLIWNQKLFFENSVVKIPMKVYKKIQHKYSHCIDQPWTTQIGWRANFLLNSYVEGQFFIQILSNFLWNSNILEAFEGPQVAHGWHRPLKNTAIMWNEIFNPKKKALCIDHQKGTFFGIWTRTIEFRNI